MNIVDWPLESLRLRSSKAGISIENVNRECHSRMSYAEDAKDNPAAEDLVCSPTICLFSCPCDGFLPGSRMLS